MSNDDETPGFGVFPFPIPGNLGAQIGQMMDTAGAHHDDTKNKFFRFMEEQPPESLATVMEMLGWGADAEVGRMRLAHMLGWGEAVMRLKHPHLCRNCGKSDCKGSLASALGKPEMTDDEKARLLVEYNLVPAGDIFQCRRCAMPYQTLEDRMRREPGEANCPGCREKTRWG